MSLPEQSRCEHQKHQHRNDKNQPQAAADGQTAHIHDLTPNVIFLFWRPTGAKPDSRAFSASRRIMTKHEIAVTFFYSLGKV
ncbi:hypothetical protein ALQ08_103529 [Pseudomonas syringae pv. delphinii]|uniref:Uncharacterized protein n=2 Tax=Pseudomonas syringae group TaxID=136849 RepID=A0A0P9Q3Z0_9PSED|nr:hypothetical protein ALO72_102839 [Pseudomonas syringae pv. delphinii]RMP15291.1 hypothetical protein ALQ28_103350 [Pseudomonas syringae pv. delphinii]RMP16694.1 hypothetical protein ALQ27_103597 [Pseudomonas syringae pv. delphinii]RMQ29031.1 hypothetical protein ALQ08_103529 [Pseudomonas syringae pv. delphinii]RMU25773.1 hypothetical protein ALP32_103352 [Pseudomonas avellanae]